MQKRIAIPFLLFGLFIFSFAEAQVKIGDNPQVIDPASILELESSDKVLVITRVDSLQMTTIVPNRGALVYNTTADCVFYYDGAQWVNMCGTDAGPNGPLTADPIVNDISTIVITPTANGDNFEVAPNSIKSEQIVNGGINGVDIQDGSIGQGKLQDNSVTQNKLSENSVGAFALDNDNVDLGDFTNNAGFITGADIISADPSNVITDSNGAFYDDSGLQTTIAANTTAIAADDDQSATNEIQSLSIVGDQLAITGANTVTIPTASGSNTRILDGTNTTVTGSGIVGDEYRINVADQADPSITNELTDLDFDIGTNILSLTNGATLPGSTVDLSSLAGGGTGTTEEADGTSITGIGTNADPFKIEPGDADQILRTNAAGDAVAWIDFPTGTGSNQNLASVLTEGNDGGAILIKNILDPVDPQDAATRAYVDASILAGGTLTDGSILIGGAGDAAQQLAVNGDALLDNTGLLTIQDGAINSDKILDGTIGLVDFNANGASVDGETIQWDTTANAGAGGWVIADNPNAPTGVTNSIFFADTDGTLTTADDNAFANDDGGLFWDPEGRRVSTQGFGALYVGLDGATNTKSTIAKVQIMEQVVSGISYALHLQNDTNNTGTAVGTLFSVEGEGGFGKGALVYERTGGFAVGDFHFLQNPNADTSVPTLAQKAFTVRNNGDIKLYAGLDASNGLGTAGQVLSSTGTGVEWVAGGSGADDQQLTLEAGNLLTLESGGTPIDLTTFLDNQNIEGSLLTDQSLTIGIEGGTSQDVDLGSFATEVEVAAAIAASGSTDDQQLTLEAGNLLTLESGGTPIDLTTFLDNQNIAGSLLTDQSLTIGIEGGNSQDVDLGSFATEVEVAAAIAASGSTDNQQLTLETGNLLTLEDGGTAIDLTVFLDDQNSSEVAYDNTVSALAAVNVKAAIDELAAASGGDNLSNTNLQQTLNTIRTYDINGGDLIFTGGGNIGVGNGANPPQNKFHVAGEIRSEGYNSSEGTEALPAYAFSTGDDINTGMYRPAADQLGFSAGGQEVLRLEESVANGLEIIANGSLELEAELVDIAGNSGTAGQVLTSTGTGVEWSAAVGGTTVNTNTDKITGNGDTIDLSIAIDAITSVELDGDAVRSPNILNGTILSEDIGAGEIKPINIETESIDGDLIEDLAVRNQELADDAVTTDKILNGTILDEDISGGISGLKIIPDFGAQNIITNGTVTVGGAVVHPDYVFEQYFNGFSKLKADYKFQSLEEIDAFVKKYHHLPGIKSAAQVKKEGTWNLSESNIQNLEKIEELYLHTINQEKEINRLKSEKETLAKELAVVKKDIAEIKALLKK